MILEIDFKDLKQEDIDVLVKGLNESIEFISSGKRDIVNKRLDLQLLWSNMAKEQSKVMKELGATHSTTSFSDIVFNYKGIEISVPHDKPLVAREIGDFRVSAYTYYRGKFIYIGEWKTAQLAITAVDEYLLEESNNKR